MKFAESAFVSDSMQEIQAVPSTQKSKQLTCPLTTLSRRATL